MLGGKAGAESIEGSLLLQEVDDLMAVAGAVALAGDVDPVDATVGGLLDELVVVAVVHDPSEPSV